MSLVWAAAWNHEDIHRLYKTAPTRSPLWLSGEMVFNTYSKIVIFMEAQPRSGNLAGEGFVFTQRLLLKQDVKYLLCSRDAIPRQM